MKKITSEQAQVLSFAVSGGKDKSPARVAMEAMQVGEHAIFEVGTDMKNYSTITTMAKVLTKKGYGVFEARTLANKDGVYVHRTA